MSDSKVYSLFSSLEQLGVTKKELDYETGTLSLQEMDENFVRNLLIGFKPKCFSDLVQIFGLSNGTNVWTNNAEEILKKGNISFRQVIAIRDSIMLYLMSLGFQKNEAYKIMNIVRKGQSSSNLTKEQRYVMSVLGADDWYIESCDKIHYLIQKAHAVLYVMNDVRLAWYKLYYPVEYYAAYFTAINDGFDVDAVIAGKEKVKMELTKLKSREPVLNQVELKTLKTLHIEYEATIRGVKFLPPDTEKSHHTEFTVENGEIRLPIFLMKPIA